VTSATRPERSNMPPLLMMPWLRRKRGAMR
jgi:hypothetical protein